MSNPDWLLPDVETLESFPAEKIADQLSRLERYAGACPVYWSVARHSLLVAALVPDDPVLKLMALVHDAHECWTGDILRPASKRVKFALKGLQDEVDQKLWALLGIDPDLCARSVVDKYDTLACEYELGLLGKSSRDVLREIHEPKTAVDLFLWNWDSTQDHVDWHRAFIAAKERID